MTTAIIVALRHEIMSGKQDVALRFATSKEQHTRADQPLAEIRFAYIIPKHRAAATQHGQSPTDAKQVAELRPMPEQETPGEYNKATILAFAQPIEHTIIRVLEIVTAITAL